MNVFAWHTRIGALKTDHHFLHNETICRAICILQHEFGRPIVVTAVDYRRPRSVAERDTPARGRCRLGVIDKDLYGGDEWPSIWIFISGHLNFDVQVRITAVFSEDPVRGTPRCTA